MPADERYPQNFGRWKADGWMVTYLVGQGKRKPNCLQGGVPSPAAEHWKRTKTEALELLKFRGRGTGLKQRMGHKFI